MRRTLSLIGALSILTLLASTTTASPPTYLRLAKSFEGKGAPGVLPRAGPSEPSFCFTREELDRINDIIASEEHCRAELMHERMSKVVEAPGDWETWEVVLLSVGVGLAALGVGFGVGYAVADLQ